MGLTAIAFGRLAAMVAALVVVSGLAFARPDLTQQAAPSLDAQVDALFGAWSATTPGCAVGASVRVHTHAHVLDIAGRYRSTEIETAVTLEVRDGSLPEFLMLALRTLVVGLWVLPVVFAGRMLLVWHDLPASMASHFSGGEPDAYLPRWAILAIAVGAMAFAASSATFTRKSGPSAAISAAVTVLLFAAFWQVIDVGLGHGGVSVGRAAIPAVIVGAVFGWFSMRPPPSPSA